jgi:DNA-binding NtrC family response regulator
MKTLDYFFKGRILVIDDSDDTLSAVEKALATWGHKVYSTREPGEGIRLIEQCNLDVALIDICFSQDGVDETGMRILECAVKKPFLEPIMMTAYGKKATAIESLRKGAFDYIEKGPGEHGTDRGFLNRIGDAIERALATRTVHHALFDALKEIKVCMDHLNRLGKGGPLVDNAQNAVRLAVQAYGRLAKTRGKKPDV